MTSQAGDPAGQSFQGLLLRHRGRTGLTQRQLASRMGVHPRSVQDWEGGVNYPNAERLRALIAALLEADGLAAGREIADAEALWGAALRAARRMRTPFDHSWFTDLLATRATAPDEDVAKREGMSIRAPDSVDNAAMRRQDWGDAPDVFAFRGRIQELAILDDWVSRERCRLLVLHGTGGIGKTMLAARVAEEFAPSYELLYWRNLRNAPSVMEWLGGTISFFSGQQRLLPETESAGLKLLLELLRERRCLLFLDNFETLLEPNRAETGYRDGYAGYGTLLQVLSEGRHQSCLVLTSREVPPDLALLGGGRAVRELELGGLGVADGRALLDEKQLSGDAVAWTGLVEHYGGNGLALKVVGETIRQVFGGDITSFLAQTGPRTVFGGIRRLLDSQVERLSEVEQDLLLRLAVEREAVSLADIATDMAPSIGPATVLDAIEALRRRSLVERGERGATFTLQPIVLEYMTDRLVERVAEEVERAQPALLERHPLVKAQSRDYVRRSQERLIGQPLVAQLVGTTGSTDGAERLLLNLLERWRCTEPTQQGYGPGNVVNLLRLLRGELRGLDLSQLAIRHAYLAGVEVQDASLAGSHFAETLLAEAFNYPTSIALSADGTYLAAGTSTGEVRLWRVMDRTPVLSLQGHTDLVWGVALSVDGQLVASGSYDGTVKLWEGRSGHLRAALRGHTGGVVSVALSRDGQLVASSSLDQTVKLWDGNNGQLLATLEHPCGVSGVGLSGNGRLVASGGDDGIVRLWEGSSGQALGKLEGHTGGVHGVAVSPDGRLVASSGFDGTVRLWEVGSGQLLATLQGHTGGVHGAALSGDGQLLASSGFDGLVKLWEVCSGQLLATLQGHTGGVLGVAMSEDGQLVASGSYDGTVRLWEAKSGHLLATVQGFTGGVRDVALNVGDDCRLVASASFDGTVRLWEASSGRHLNTLRGHSGGVVGVALSGDGRLVASSGFDKTVRLWEGSTGSYLRTLEGPTGLVRGVAQSEDGRLVAGGSFDGTVRLWEAESGRLMATLPGHTAEVLGVALSRNGGFVASGSGDGTVRLWATSGGRLLTTLQGHSGRVVGVALSGDGRVVASASYDGTVRLWEARSGQPLATLEGHTAGVLGVALSRDAELVASGGYDGTVRLWAAASGRLLATLQGHMGAIWSVALSADGRLVASGSVDGTVKLWEASSGDCVRTLRGDRRYERMDITGLTGVTEAERLAMIALGAVDRTLGIDAANTAASLETHSA